MTSTDRPVLEDRLMGVVRTPVHTGQFLRDTRRAQRRGEDMSKLRGVLNLLIAAGPLPASLKDHPLTGEWSGYRDCHIEPIGCFSIRSTATILFWPEQAAMPTCSSKTCTALFEGPGQLASRLGGRPEWQRSRRSPNPETGTDSQGFPCLVRDLKRHPAHQDDENFSLPLALSRRGASAPWRSARAGM
jgi:mRNA interferase YafQ